MKTFSLNYWFRNLMNACLQFNAKLFQAMRRPTLAITEGIISVTGI